MSKRVGTYTLLHIHLAGSGLIQLASLACMYCRLPVLSIHMGQSMRHSTSVLHSPTMELSVATYTYTAGL